MAKAHPRQQGYRLQDRDLDRWEAPKEGDRRPPRQIVQRSDCKGPCENTVHYRASSSNGPSQFPDCRGHIPYFEILKRSGFRAKIVENRTEFEFIVTFSEAPAAQRITPAMDISAPF